MAPAMKFISVYVSIEANLIVCEIDFIAVYKLKAAIYSFCTFFGRLEETLKYDIKIEEERNLMMMTFEM